MKGVRILVVDNDIDSRYLWTCLLEEYGADVTAFGSIKDAIAALDLLVPDILICEIRFLGEQVDPLIKRIKQIAAGNASIIPIVVTSTSPFNSLPQCLQHLKIEIETYWIKPIDVNNFVDALFRLTAPIG